MPFKKGQSGNPAGRPKTSWREDFESAIEKVEKEHDTTLFEHAVKESFTDNTLLAAILKKRLPDLKSIEARVVSESPYRLVIELPRPTTAKVLLGSDVVKLPDTVTSNRKPVKSVTRKTKASKVKTKQKDKLSD